MQTASFDWAEYWEGVIQGGFGKLPPTLAVPLQTIRDFLEPHIDRDSFTADTRELTAGELLQLGWLLGQAEQRLRKCPGLEPVADAVTPLLAIVASESERRQGEWQ
jgi:hypothetical protein